MSLEDEGENKNAGIQKNTKVSNYKVSFNFFYVFTGLFTSLERNQQRPAFFLGRKKYKNKKKKKKKKKTSLNSKGGKGRGTNKGRICVKERIIMRKSMPRLAVTKR
eukprot:TRINITY_DN6926_c4_g1_i1.p2 TRINITY_DN6926_c4_g1~~TRINITY_DN6926_c4_g1_i1.p2  ORF type:complete len:106 (-),score=3.42 TRINITY_DN6926_c4_g1_i1:196-513(-)